MKPSPLSDQTPAWRSQGWPFYVLSLVLWSITLGLAPALTAALHAKGNITAAQSVAFAGALGGMLSLFVGLGVEDCQSVWGVLRSGRNTYSLSRLQMVLWTWLILSAVMAVAACRGWGLGGIDPNTALDIQIDSQLFAVMGISFFTGAATPALLAIKSQGSTDPGAAAIATDQAGEPMFVKGSVVSRPTDQPPRLGDLVNGDDVGSVGVVDLSKVQQLLITLVLVALYAGMLFRLFHSDQLVNMHDKDHSGWTALPAFPDSFVKLLLLSHAGYLGYKAVPKAGALASGSDGSTPGPAPSPPGPPPAPSRQSPMP